MADYAPPVDKLLTLGDPSGERIWRDYRPLGISTEQIPDLIRMALDENLNMADSASKEVWAPVHAWRALGQLRAQAAIEPLLNLFRRIDENDDDWVGEDLPRAYGMIGATAIPALAAYLADKSHGLWARVGASSAVGKIGKQYPESRAESATALTRQLEHFSENDPVLNGSLLADLLDLNAVESAPVIERAFAAGTVEEEIAGDWEDVQVEFGLTDQRTTPKPRSPLAAMFERITSQTSAPPPPSNPQVDAVIAKMRADGVLKSAAKPKAEKHKKKHKKKK